MKRSDALNKLGEILEQANGHIVEELNKDWLLTMIENYIGMFPPPIIIERDDIHTIGFYGGVETESFHDTIEYKWEEE